MLGFCVCSFGGGLLGFEFWVAGWVSLSCFCCVCLVFVGFAWLYLISWVSLMLTCFAGTCGLVVVCWLGLVWLLSGLLFSLVGLLLAGLFRLGCFCLWYVGSFVTVGC